MSGTMSENTIPPKWEILEEELQADCRIFKVYRRLCKHPVDDRLGNFYTIKSSDFVLVLAITEDKELILIRQYRFGADEVHLEIPGGLVNKDEDHKAAAARELLEETGYSGSAPLVIGSCRPNPAIFNNRAYFVLIQDCKKTAPVNWDHHEEIHMASVPLDDVEELVASGALQHAISITGLYYLQAFLKLK